MLSEKKKRKCKLWSKKWCLKRNISCDVHLLNELLETDVPWDDAITVRQVNWGNCGIPWVNCTVLWKTTGKDSSKACAITYLLTYSMVQSSSWEANWFAASQEIPCISRNLKVHYRTYKRPPPLSILGQPNPVHIPTSYLLEIHPNIIHPSTSRSPQWSPSLWFPQQDPIHPLSSPLHATCPAHLILLDFITRTILGEEYKSFSSSLCNLLHSPVQII